MWGLLQQLLVQGIVAANLARVPNVLGTPASVTIVAGCLFGVVHLPDPPLTAATALLGFCLTPIYLKWRNLWPLGVGHGWLGVLFYFWALGRDPWVEMFG